jgi:hypothetical protein
MLAGNVRSSSPSSIQHRLDSHPSSDLVRSVADDVDASLHKRTCLDSTFECSQKGLHPCTCVKVARIDVWNEDGGAGIDAVRNQVGKPSNTEGTI